MYGRVKLPPRLSSPAFRELRTAEPEPSLSGSQIERRPAFRTGKVGFERWGFGRLDFSLFIEFQERVAFRIVRAGKERTKPPVSQNHSSILAAGTFDACFRGTGPG